MVKQTLLCPGCRKPLIHLPKDIVRGSWLHPPKQQGEKACLFSDGIEVVETNESERDLFLKALWEDNVSSLPPTPFSVRVVKWFKGLFKNKKGGD